MDIDDVSQPLGALAFRYELFEKVADVDVGVTIGPRNGFGSGCDGSYLPKVRSLNPIPLRRTLATPHALRSLNPVAL